MKRKDGGFANAMLLAGMFFISPLLLWFFPNVIERGIASILTIISTFFFIFAYIIMQRVAER